MKIRQDQLPSRRQFIKTTGQFAAVSALAGVAIPHVHAAGDNTIRLALIGCGGRGSGAVANAMSAGGAGAGGGGGRAHAAAGQAGAGARWQMPGRGAAGSWETTAARNGPLARAQAVRSS